jgi:methyl-accepting chemotaxis protein
MLSNLKISQKIYLQGVIQLALMILMGGVAIFQMAKLGVEIFEIAEEDIPLTRMITKATEHQLEQAIYLERVFFKATLVKEGYPGAQTELDKNIKKVSEYQKKVHKEVDEAAAFAKGAMGKLHTEEAKAEYRKIISGLTTVSSELTQLEEMTDVVIGYASAGNTELLIKNAKEIEAYEDKIDEELIALLDNIQNFTQKSALQAEADEQFAIKLIIGLFIVSVLVSIFLPFVISRSIVVPVKNLHSRLVDVVEGDGDLRLRLDDSARDETGDVARAFNKFMTVLNNVIKNVSSQADELGTSAETGLRVMETTLTNVETQHRETEQVAAAVEEMSTTTKEIAKSTNDASQVADVVRDKVREGQGIAQSTQKIIEQLAEEVNDASEVIAGLMAETNNIGQVTDTIQGIAEQTNLLALNAAIEAARAGESGRGFAVVADEVRSLAQRTRDSTVDIQDLVQRLQEQANKAVNSMERGKDSTLQCLEKGVETARAFDEASVAVSEISDLNTQIATASEEQDVVSQDVNNTLLKLTQIAEDTSKGFRESSTANEIIAKRLIDLHSNINIFQTS